MIPLTSKLIKTFWIVLGFFFVAVGSIGMITPIMPGLVFFLIATFCFAKGSRKFLKMLLNNKYVGPQISDFRKGKGMTIKTKITAILVLLTGTSVSAFVMVETIWVKWAICLTGLTVTAIILMQKTNTKS